jgi:hypothetical protein
VQSEKMPHAQPALHSRRGAAVRGSRLEDSHRHSWHARAVSLSLAKGGFDSGGHESARESIEIPETPAAAFEMMWPEEDDHGDDGNTPSHSCGGWSTATDRT